MKRVPLLSALSLLVLAAACRTAGTRVAPPSAVPPDLLAPYVGELRLFPQGAEKARIQLDARSKPAEGCAVAVRVRAAAFVKGAVRLTLETLGTPRLREQRASCRRMQPQLELTVAGLSTNPGAPEITARLDEILQTPEAYLAARGVSFDLPAGAAPSEVASREVFATAVETSLGRRVKAWPSPLLSVDPWYHDRGGRIHQESELELDAVVGVDGRLHQPRIRTPLGDEHTRHVLSSLPLWRFTPGRGADAPVAVRVSLRPVLHIY